jgi:hypothetical protein
MAERGYWLDLFTGSTWQEFLQHGGEVSGFRKTRWTSVQRLKVGDYLLAYLTGVSRFIGVLEVTSPAYQDASPIWSLDAFPCRVHVKVVEKLTPETAVPILDLRDRLTIFQGLKNPNLWQGAVRGSLTLWNQQDGEAVVEAIRHAKEHPTQRPVDQRKLARRPSVMTSKTLGEVTIPDDESIPGDVEAGTENGTGTPSDSTTGKEPTAHTEMQYLLLKLGSDMGLNVWVATGDRGKEWLGSRFDSIPNCLSDLPIAFDDATNRMVRNIDVLWLDGNSIQAAFEIESTTSIYSGLLRMSDLLSMQPNLNIPLFIVAPDERRGKVIAEVNRATFLRLKPRLVDICRYIPFSSLRELRDHMANAPSYIQGTWIAGPYSAHLDE